MPMMICILPNWDSNLYEEVKKINHKNFYLSMTHISHIDGVKGDIQHIKYDCGSNINEFDENKLLNNFKNFNLEICRVVIGHLI